ncbi:hypothetical protein [Paenibacillus graminis]|uniref:hypothetical protein n=1 Tax=Paenibacillus graminis TaxID=189425 RepID=UPI002DB7792A|nr:hypothetical protein [Paenibacillus graminis]MEC0167419.1 hypothetical protein [Paenibacillus graminis]
MEYKDLLKSYIDKSTLSLSEIEKKMRDKGFSTNKAYISKLQNGVHPPAGEDITRALAEVTGGDVDALLLAGYIEKAPDEIKSILTEATNTGQLFAFFALLISYVEKYRSSGVIDEELLQKIEVTNEVFANEYKYRLSTSFLKDFPEYAVELIVRLKQHFIPLTESISYRGVKINFADYVSKENKPIFKENPYPEIKEAAEAVSLEKLKDEQPAIAIPYEEELDSATQQKIIFFESLESDLELDLTDPEIQKKLKRAAKIIFSSED